MLSHDGHVSLRWIIAIIGLGATLTALFGINSSIQKNRDLISHGYQINEIQPTYVAVPKWVKVDSTKVEAR